MAACTFAATSGGMVVIPCAVLACSAPLAITSATSFPSMTKLQPGITSPHLRILAMLNLLWVVALPRWDPTRAPGGYHPTPASNGLAARRDHDVAGLALEEVLHVLHGAEEAVADDLRCLAAV